MNFSFSDLSAVIWGGFWVIGTIFLYFVDMKRKWIEERNESGLSKPGVKCRICFWNKYPTENKTYFKDCIFLIFFSAINSLIILMFSAIQRSKLSYDGIIEVFSAFIGLGIFHVMLMGVPINEAEISNEVNKKLSILFIKIKEFCIESLINNERDYLFNHIIKEIEKIYDSNYDELGNFVLRLSGRFLTNKMNQTLTADEKENYSEALLEIFVLYSNDDPNLLSELRDFFESVFTERKIKLIDLTIFIQDHEATKSKMSKTKISKKIKQYIEKGNGYVKPTNISSLQDVIENEIEQECRETNVI